MIIKASVYTYVIGNLKAISEALSNQDVTIQHSKSANLPTPYAHNQWFELPVYRDTSVYSAKVAKIGNQSELLFISYLNVLCVYTM